MQNNVLTLKLWNMHRLDRSSVRNIWNVTLVLQLQNVIHIEKEIDFGV